MSERPTRDPFEELFGKPESVTNDHSAQADAATTQTPAAPAAPSPADREAVEQVLDQALTARLAALASESAADAPAPQPAGRLSSGFTPGSATREEGQTQAPSWRELREERAAGPKRTGSIEPTASGSGAGAADRRAVLLPWLIVGVVVAIAIAVASVVLVSANAARQDSMLAAQQAEEKAKNDTSDEAQQQTKDEDAAGQEADTQDDSTQTKDTDKQASTDNKDAATGDAPKVDVGGTFDMPIGPWDATSQISQKFERIFFNIPDGEHLYLSGGLLDSFPDSCAQLREAWGATKKADGTYELLKPTQTCAAAPELYNEVWGLLAAWVETIKPAS